jgi:hypothetical protein
MAEPNIPTCLTDPEVAVHTVPLPGEAKVLIFVEEKMSSTNDGVGVSSRRWVEGRTRSTAKRARLAWPTRGSTRPTVGDGLVLMR